MSSHTLKRIDEMDIALVGGMRLARNVCARPGRWTRSGILGVQIRPSTDADLQTDAHRASPCSRRLARFRWSGGDGPAAGGVIALPTVTAPRWLRGRPRSLCDRGPAQGRTDCNAGPHTTGLARGPRPGRGFGRPGLDLAPAFSASLSRCSCSARPAPHRHWTCRRCRQTRHGRGTALRRRRVR